MISGLNYRWHFSRLHLEDYDPNMLTYALLRQRIGKIICGGKIYCTLCKTPSLGKEFSQSLEGAIHIHHKLGKGHELYKNSVKDEDFIKKYYDVLCAWCHAIHHGNIDIALSAIKLRVGTWIHKEMSTHILRNIEYYQSTEKFKALTSFYPKLENARKQEKKRTEIFKAYIENNAHQFNGTKIDAMIDFVNRRERQYLTEESPSILMERDIEAILKLLKWQTSGNYWYAPIQTEDITPVYDEIEPEPIEGWNRALQKTVRMICTDCGISFSYDEDSLPWSGIIVHRCVDCSELYDLEL
jgi:hypothetical protein